MTETKKVVGEDCAPMLFYEGIRDKSGELFTFYGCKYHIEWHKAEWGVGEQAQAYYLWYYGYRDLNPNYDQFVKDLNDKEKDLFMQVAKDFSIPVWSKLIEDISNNPKIFKVPKNKSSTQILKRKARMIKEVSADLQTNFASFPSTNHIEGLIDAAKRIKAWKHKKITK